ncbi:hypothetical protein D3C81_1349430 [compost metagenome]
MILADANDRSSRYFCCPVGSKAPPDPQKCRLSSQAPVPVAVIRPNRLRPAPGPRHPRLHRHSAPGDLARCHPRLYPAGNPRALGPCHCRSPYAAGSGYRHPVPELLGRPNSSDRMDSRPSTAGRRNSSSADPISPAFAFRWPRAAVPCQPYP